MAIESVLAGITVSDFTAGVSWYERLFGRPADATPMEGLAAWRFSPGGGLQVIHDESRAGSTSATIVVTSLDNQLAELKSAGIPAGPLQGTPGLVKVVTVTDPEGNQVVFAEDLTDKT